MSDLFSELKRRNVFRVGIAYVVLGWVLVQVGDIMFTTFGAPDWVMKALVGALALGFPVALIFSWAFELTPEGIKKEKNVDRSQSITDHTARKLDVVVIVLLVVAIGMFAYQSFVATPATQVSETVSQVDTTQPVDERASVAVLPFFNMSSSEENEYFSDGLTETLLHMLAQVPDLRVPARTSSFAFKGKNTDVREIAAQLNVKTVLEGSVQRAGQRVRITAQLVDAADGSHIWSQSFDRELDDIFAIQDEIANAVAQALMESLLGESANSVNAPTVASVSTTNVEAYDIYLHALEEFNKRSFTSVPVAEQLFLQALDLDPGFDEARYRLMDTYAFMQSTGLISPPEAAAHIEDVLQPLLERDPVPAKANVYVVTVPVFKASFAVAREVWEEQETAYLRAISLMPNDSNLYYRLANIVGGQFTLNRPEEAIVILDRGLEVDPMNIDLMWTKGVTLIQLMRLEEAQAVYEHMIDLFPETPTGYWGLRRVYEARGEYDQAILKYYQAFEIDRQDHEIPAAIAFDLVRIGLVNEARPWLAHAERLNAEGEETRRSRIFVETAAGNIERAIELAEREIRGKSGTRRGLNFFSVFTYMHLMQQENRLDEALAVIEETFPGMLDGGEIDPGNPYELTATVARPYAYLDADSETLAQVTAEVARQHIENGSPLHSFPLGAPYLVWEGREADAKALLLGALNHIDDFSPVWRVLILQHPALQTLLQEPEVKAGFEAMEARFAQHAQSYKDMVARGDIVVPGESQEQ